jgi:FdrA protein
MRHVEARAGAYSDSVTLMQISAQAQEVEGVRAALVAMATELNQALAADLGLQAPAGSGPNDLLVAVDAHDDRSLATALAVIDNALTSRPPEDNASAAGQPPRTGRDRQLPARR